MASKSQSNAGKPPKSASPISAHPAFPLVVALWFGALLGLGSLILPVALIESLTTATGLANLIPAAAPPLGMTARIAVAVFGTILGGLLGLFAARRIARPAPEEQPRRRSFKADTNPRRLPLSPREELGSDSFDSVAGFATARRTVLASEEEESKTAVFHPAPLPEQAPEPSTGRGFDYAEQALDLGESTEFAEPPEPVLHTAAPEEPIAMTAKQVFSVVPGKPPLDPLPFSPPSMARQVPRAAQEEHEVAESEPEAEPPQEFIAPPVEEMPEAAEAPELSEPAGQEAAPEVSAPQDAEPGLIQLVQKLGNTLEKHREWNAQRKAVQAEASQFPRAVAAPALASAFDDHEFDVAAPAEAAQATAAFFAPEIETPDETEVSPETEAELPEYAPPPATAPTPATVRQLRPFAGLPQLDVGDDDELDQLAASFSLPLNRAAAAPKDETSGSLTGINNPFRDNRPQFVRIEEPELDPEAALPTVVFPHDQTAAVRAFDRPGPVGVSASTAPQRPAPQRPSIASDDNDRVLREALMNLQRIGKI